MHYLKKWLAGTKKVILTPHAFFRQMKKRDDFGHSLKFLVVTLAVFGIAQLLIVDQLLLGKAIGISVLFFFATLVAGVGFFHLFSGAMQFMLWVFGSRHSYQDTYHALAHYYPVAMLGTLIVNIVYYLSAASGAETTLLPNFITALVTIFMIYTQTVGLSIVHKMGFFRTLLATVIIPLAIITISMLAAGMFFYSMPAGIGLY